jgi:DNA polymerase I-like protein with 3'-5' exonuclease and polymerase domains
MSAPAECFATGLTLPPWLVQARCIGLDIETSGLDPWRDTVTALSISDGTEALVIDLRGVEPEALRDWLERHVFDNKLVIIHNALFDLVFLRHRTGCAYPERLFDTFLAETLLTAGLFEDGDDDDDGETARRVRMSCSLAAAAKRRLGVLLDKDSDIRTGFQVEAEWSEAMLRYAAEDSRVLVPLYQRQRQALRNEQMVTVAKIEFDALPVFCEMRLRGIAVDAAGIQPLLDKARSEADYHREHLERVLTKHVLWARKRRNAEIEARFAAWRSAIDAMAEEAASEWDAIMASDDPRAGFSRWLGVAVPGSSQPEITAAEIDTWLDTTPRNPKLAGDPKGRARYVKRVVQWYRTTPEGKRPTGMVVDINAPINIRSPQQKMQAIQDYLEEFNREHGTELAPPDNLRRGTLVGWALDVPHDVYAELVEPLIAFARADKIVTAFGASLLNALDNNGILHGGWRQIGTATGRPSCSEPNLLNIPSSSSFRGYFRAREGQVFIVADYSQMELRELAEFSGDAAMIDAFRNGVDLHALTASAIFGTPVAEVTDDQRKRAKIVNFGISYGMHGSGLRRAMMGWGIRVTPDEADTYLERWRKTFSAAWAWIEAKGQEGVKRGYVATPLGRRRYFNIEELARLELKERLYREGKIRREAANHPIQGGNADVTKLAMALIQEHIAPLGGSVVLQVYDEIVSEVPAAVAREAREIVIASMIAAAETVLTTVPVAVDAVISPSWNEKEALA